MMDRLSATTLDGAPPQLEARPSVLDVMVVFVPPIELRAIVGRSYSTFSKSLELALHKYHKDSGAIIKVEYRNHKTIFTIWRSHGTILAGTYTMCEAAYFDLWVTVSDATIAEQVVQSIHIIWSWLRAIWRLFDHHAIMCFFSAVGILIHMMWMYSVMTAVFVVIGKTGPPPMGDFFLWLGSKLGGWWPAVVLGTLQVVAPIDFGADVSAGVRHYQVDSRLRSRMSARVNDVLSGIEQSDVIVVGHSFGAVVALQALWQRQPRQEFRFDFIELGAPFDSLSALCTDVEMSIAWLQQRVNSGSATWAASCNKFDILWLSTASGTFKKGEVAPDIIKPACSQWECFMQLLFSTAHSSYLSDDNVLRRLLRQLP
eukprot:TRINITY_DN607_c0_g2_i2.p1 TRINITY_DN607_c0_g2~~TRINITY_DN607_c0_g2_i2.p1  ORF type:complete len:371 (+),score=65.80 TRINITY_DN607_c0_g2_i2:191-1303(+)